MYACMIQWNSGLKEHITYIILLVQPSTNVGICEGRFFDGYQKFKICSSGENRTSVFE